MSTSAKSSATRPPTKKRVNSAAADETKKSLRAKTSKKSEEACNADNGILALQWMRKSAGVEEHRQIMAQSSDRRNLLIPALNEVRALDGRPALSSRQLDAIPPIERLHDCLLTLFQSPLTFDPIAWPDQLVRRTETIQDPESNVAQYYLRRLAFDSAESLYSFCSAVEDAKPQYSGHLAILKEASQKLPVGPRYILYWGFTIATTVQGRLHDDQTSDSYCLIKSALAKYTGVVECYEFSNLRFEVGPGGTASVLQSRRDCRTALFESLIIDSLGYLCLNTHPAGMVLDHLESTNVIALRAAYKADKAQRTH
ncbi:MAG: hypothetical protein CYPHOPRED_001908 [Cyphobasidiales sp. Tagirdzhanova-0007]|nr:MAG: hypothetical protein CYPHOPRED_001908 [Cyphobasidiales sp. Tagirdzhanova-0007]